MGGAPAKRQAVGELIAAGLSQTRACAALATSRSSLAYVPRAHHDEALVAAIQAIHKRKPRWGYKRVHAQLRREGHQVNRKLVLRLWRELGFKELERLFSLHGRPTVLRSDSGPEFVACELTKWLAEVGAATFDIEPGKPWQNGYAESFNARLRDECLNMEEFWSLPHARALIEAWRIEYNSEHPHSSLGCLTPDEFTERCTPALEQDAA